VPLLITEGEKKTLKANQEGMPCIGLGGLWNWRHAGRPIADLDRIDWFGRDTVLVPDGDVWTRADLLQPVYALGRELEARGAIVGVLKCPPRQQAADGPAGAPSSWRRGQPGHPSRPRRLSRPTRAGSTRSRITCGTASSAAPGGGSLARQRPSRPAPPRAGALGCSSGPRTSASCTRQDVLEASCGTASPWAAPRRARPHHARFRPEGLLATGCPTISPCATPTRPSTVSREAAPAVGGAGTARWRRRWTTWRPSSCATWCCGTGGRRCGWRPGRWGRGATGPSGCFRICRSGRRRSGAGRAGCWGCCSGSPSTPRR
jgi:hypothetical protein